MKRNQKGQLFGVSVLILLLTVLVLAVVQVSDAAAESRGESLQSGITLGGPSMPMPVINATPLAAEVINRRVVENVISTPELAHFGGGLGGQYDDWYHTPVPKSTPVPPVSGTVITSISESVSNVFHHLVFPVQTISDALLEIFTNALTNAQGSTVAQEKQWISAFSSLFQAPHPGAYATIANGGLRVAAGIAVALFILRLAIYNWNRLLGEDDDAVRVVGDWLTAGVLALVAGPLLDLINQVGWWVTGAVIGNPAALGQIFADGLINTMQGGTMTMALKSFIGPIIIIALLVASMLAVIGIIVAFASGHAVMFVLAVLGPVVMVAGVVPKMRWLRGMWLQATVVVAFLPIVAAAVFKAGLDAAASITGGLAQEIFHILWLFGVTGFLLSLSGILSKFTIGAAGEAMGKMAKIGKGIIESAVLAGGALATGGAGGVGAAGAALAAGGGGLGGGGGAGVASLGAGEAAVGSSSAIGGFSAWPGGLSRAASQHLGNAQSAIGKADTASAFGFDRLASHYQRQASGEGFAARQAELNARMEQQAGGDSPKAASPGFGYTPTVDAALSNHYPGSDGLKVFNEGLQGLSPHLSSSVLDPSVTPHDLMQSHPEDMMKMVDTWNVIPDYFSNSRDPIRETMDSAGVSDAFRSLFQGS
jgi:hypothetical protein